MTSIPVEVEPSDTAPQRVTSLVSDAFVRAAEQLGIKDTDALVLGELLLSSIALTTETAIQLKGGRELCAELLEQGLRAGPDGFVLNPKGRNRIIDSAIASVVESRFPTPTKTVRNEVTLNGCVVWFSVEDDAYWVESLESQPRMVMSAAAACALCDSGSGADSIYRR